MFVDVLLGLQWGDEGKGKIVDFLANDYQCIARFQGGANAGHTLYYQGQKVVLHLIPSGALHPHLLNFIGSGVVIDPVVLRREIINLQALGVNIAERLIIARKAHLTLPTHKILDAASETAKAGLKIGSTLKGISPTYMDKIGRNGLRIGDITHPNFKQFYEQLKAKHIKILEQQYAVDYQLDELENEWFESLAFLQQQIRMVDGEFFINDELQKGHRILGEGAQGTMLDIDYGTYPYVTSSTTLTAGACIGLGIAPQRINKVIGIAKAYCTRVGSGPFPSELHDATGQKLRDVGNEYGSTTGRPRRCGWLDLPALRYALMLNGVTHLGITKIDVLNEFDEINICEKYLIDGSQQGSSNWPYDADRCTIEPQYVTFKGWQQSLQNCQNYNQLPQNLQNYLQYLSQQTNLPIAWLSTGPERDQLLINTN
ncbi:MAG: adenylosuccinate synthase [Sphingobacteriales bacterium]|jgi:adenylosuccinate synthase|nr:adenylosuccinate synthase [Sphingobacteriales bacterium]MBP9141750.1 adenylosuccinate synthase [Chitinophagales bacterium]MDA0197213.1 adenylosuccinate synthase [Bacteroidota bacterium]MBK6891458.1 adenylosuccinate synthase [Sphingobacteriales bacterium]MBK7526710.1 adenylosuccinate synthase [Sphingobacteriales bacterium]